MLTTAQDSGAATFASFVSLISFVSFIRRDSGFSNGLLELIVVLSTAKDLTKRPEDSAAGERSFAALRMT
jgi:hypothetical protein